ncbi:HSP17.9A [Symbiodinium sp. KB8]|nr:HSP17.9A [Symbiodinium sp. KB8]
MARHISPFAAMARHMDAMMADMHAMHRSLAADPFMGDPFALLRGTSARSPTVERLEDAPGSGEAHHSGITGEHSDGQQVVPAGQGGGASGTGQELGFFGHALRGPRALSLDVKETDHAFEIVADVPGVPKDQVKVDVQDGSLVIEATAQGGKDESGGGEGGSPKWRRIERHSGAVRRVLRLPPNVDPEAIRGKVQDGQLHLTLPKTEAAVSPTRSVPLE